MDKNSVKHFDKILLFSKYFDMFKNKEDVTNMFLVLYQMRILQGKMSINLFNMYDKLNKKYQEAKTNKALNSLPETFLFNKEYYNVSIYEGLIDTTKSLIRECENLLQRFLLKKQEGNLEQFPESKSGDEPFLSDDLTDALTKKMFKTQTVLNDKIPEIKPVMKGGDCAAFSGSMINKSDIQDTGDLNTDKLMALKNKKYKTPTLLLFYTTRCPYCTGFMDTWTELSKNLAKDKINTFKIDADKHSDVSDRFGVQSYPSLKLLNKGKIIPFTGDRTISALTSFVKENK